MRGVGLRRKVGSWSRPPKRSHRGRWPCVEVSGDLWDLRKGSKKVMDIFEKQRGDRGPRGGMAEWCTTVCTSPSWRAGGFAGSKGMEEGVVGPKSSRC